MTECLHTSLQGAMFWIHLGYSPIPVQFRSKKPYNPCSPGGKGWQHLRITAEDAPKYFNGQDMNIGVLLGDDYGSADVDLDCPEAILLAKLFLPATGLKFGRESKPSSHWFYRVDPPIQSEALTDPVSGTMLLELRCRNKDGSVGHQTVVPPSIHKTGERVGFEEGFDRHPANVDAIELTAAVRQIGAAALLARHWPPANSGRHATMLALAGAVYRAAWSEEEAVEFCLAVYRTIPDHDRSAINRTEAEVRDTFRKARTGDATTGIPKLVEHLGDRVVGKVLEWLGIGEERDWRSHLILGANKAPKPILANAVVALDSHPEWRNVLSFNEFTASVMARKPAPWGRSGGWTDHEDLLAADWLQRSCGILVPAHIVSEAVQVVARKSPFNPLRDYLDSLIWDGVERIHDWLTTYLGADSTDYAANVGKKWLISAVARGLHPGCKADCVLILEGPQGIGKSQALQVLAGPWFTDEIADLGSKDAAMQLLGVWIIEIAELDSMTRSEVSRVKAFLSRTTDRFRPPYARRLLEQPRRCVFAGTVNSSEYMRDETGNRRLWPVACSIVHLEELRDDRDQLWAEAVRLYKQGDPWWLNDAVLVELAEEEQTDRLQSDSWQEVIEDFLASRTDVSVAEILSDCIRKDRGQWGRHDEMRVGRVMQSLKWERYKRRIEGSGNKTQWRYRPPSCS